MIKHYSLLTLLAGGLLATSATAQNVVTITDADLVGGQTYNWNANTTYILNGLVYLEEGGRLNIPAGTVVKFRNDPDGSASADNTSALITTKGAQIFAEGRADAPIIFTAEADDPSDPNDINDPQFVRGQWGGLILLGNGTLATQNSIAQIEGISAGETRASYGGGANPNDTESSGVLRYVSIRHGGRALTTDNEINGLTLGGVGRGTVIEYVEVFANDDDGIEWFGGTVDTKYAVVAYCADDSYDYDLGWRGRGQFWFSLNNNDIAGRGGEHDGAIPDAQPPYANPTIANVTYIGSGATATNVDGDGNDYAIVLRDGGAMKYYNSVFTEFVGRMLDLEDLPTASGVDSYQRLLDGAVIFRGNVIGNFGRANGGGIDSLIRRYPNGDQPSGMNVANLLRTGTRFVGNTRIVVNIDRERNAALDPRPFGTSDLLDGSLVVNIPDSLDAGNYFEDVNYVGAFPNAPGNWMDGWTALSHYGILVAPGASSTREQVISEEVTLRPNPTTEGAWLDFELKSDNEVEISIFDMSGRQISSTSEQLFAGKQRSFIHTAGLPVGTYMVRLVANNQVVSKRLMVAAN